MDDILRARISELKLDRERAQAALDRIRPSVCSSNIDPEALARFGRVMRENITTGDIPFRKASIQSVVDRIEVDDHAIRIIGDKATLEQVVAGSAKSGLGFAVLHANGAPAWMKLITTFPPEHYDIATVGAQRHPGVSKVCSIHYADHNRHGM